MLHSAITPHQPGASSEMPSGSRHWNGITGVFGEDLLRSCDGCATWNPLGTYWHFPFLVKESGPNECSSYVAQGLSTR